jgi:hypothetical protein
MLAFALGAAAGAGLLRLLQARGGAAAARGAPRFVGRPHPGWAPGDPQPPPYGAGGPVVTLDPAATDKASMYAFVISAVVPRPVAFVSTVDAAGVRNLAPYSYFNVMGHNPPVVAIGVARSPGRGGGKKDTLLNIEETGCGRGRGGLVGARESPLEGLRGVAPAPPTPLPQRVCGQHHIRLVHRGRQPHVRRL